MNLSTEAGLPSESEQKQKLHYDRISQEYNLHYSDEWSVRYRDQFLHEVLFHGLELQGKRVLDAMCGYGDVTRYLLDRGADVVGLDISEKQIEAYKARWQCEGVAASILDHGLENESFDIVVVLGALHHMPPHLNESIAAIHRLLRPGGALCFAEPHRHSILELPRQLWYRLDPLFEENEESIDIDEIENTFAEEFPRRETVYGGSFGYLFVLNSMVLRIPLWLKQYYSPIAFWLEAQFGKLKIRALTLFVAGRWHKGGTKDQP